MVITPANGLQSAVGTVAGWHENQPLRNRGICAMDIGKNKTILLGTKSRSTLKINLRTV